MRRFMLLCFPALALLASCTAPEPAPAEAGETKHESIAIERTSPHLKFVKVETVEETSEGASVELTGKVAFDENHTQRVASPVDGRATKILVELGDRVKAGQPLIELTSPNIGDLQATFAKAQQDMKLAEKSLDRANKLKADGAVSEKDLAQYEADYSKAKADVASASARLGSMNIGGGAPGAGASIRASVAGTVVDRSVLVGQEVRADAPNALITITDLSTVWVVADVYEQDLGLVKKDEKVEVTVSAYPGDKFPGVVDRVNEVLDPATRTVKLRCVLANPDNKLKPEMFAKIALFDPGGAKKIMVPARAVLSGTVPPRVIVKEGDVYRFRDVEVGPEVQGRVRVLKGLKPGEQVVTDGAIFLKTEIETQ